MSKMLVVKLTVDEIAAIPDLLKNSNSSISSTLSSSEFTHSLSVVLYHHLNSHIAYPGSPLEPSNHNRWQFLYLPLSLLLKTVLQINKKKKTGTFVLA